MDQSTGSLLVVLVAHWVGDYVFQTTAMAVNKSVSIRWLSLHVLVYSATLYAGAFLILPAGRAFQYTAVNGGLHWITDLVTSRVAVRFENRPRIWFPVIGFDQLAHTAALVVTLGWP